MKTATFKINEKNHSEASLNQWQNHFEKIYGKRNKGKDPEVLWFRVFENASKVAESLRRYQYGEAMQFVSHVLCWLSGFCSRTDRNIGRIVWEKYPSVCPYCRKDTEHKVKSCTCQAHRVEIEEAATHKKGTMIDEGTLEYFREHFKKPRTLDRWVNMFAKLYGNSNYAASIEHIGFHLMEEIGEVGRAWRRKQEFATRVQKKLEKDTDIEKAKTQFEMDIDYEIADIFSWLCALVNKISWIIEAAENFGKSANEIKFRSRGAVHFEMPEVTLSSFVFAEYGKGCPNCGKMTCTEECFVTECKFITEEKKCGFDFQKKKSCDFGKTFDQSRACGTISSV